mgnify:CR=1 FL=1
MRKDFISVIIPVFNEEKRILPAIRNVSGYLAKHFHGFEIIIVDDGSRDNTIAKVEPLMSNNGSLTLLKNKKNMGKGFSIRRGVLASSGDFILTTDADLSTPIEEIEKLFYWINNGFDIAIGSRGLKESEIAVRQPWHRETMGKIFNLIVKAIVIKGIKDTQCGFKLFKSKTAKEIFTKSVINGFSFDVEILFIATKLGGKIKEVPIRWLNSPHSSVKIARDPFIMFTDLFRIRLNYLKGIYRQK